MKNLLFLAVLFVACNDETPAPSKARPYKSVKDRALIENKTDTAFNELKRIDSIAGYYTDLSLKEYDKMNTRNHVMYAQMAAYYNGLYQRRYKRYLKDLKAQKDSRIAWRVAYTGSIKTSKTK